jgi:hypothetical protein
VVLTVPRILDLLRRAHEGEDPDLLVLELWGNAFHVEGDDE